MRRSSRFPPAKNAGFHFRGAVVSEIVLRQHVLTVRHRGHGVGKVDLGRCQAHASNVQIRRDLPHFLRRLEIYFRRVCEQARKVITSPGLLTIDTRDLNSGAEAGAFRSLRKAIGHDRFVLPITGHAIGYGMCHRLLIAAENRLVNGRNFTRSIASFES